MTRAGRRRTKRGGRERGYAHRGDFLAWRNLRKTIKRAAWRAEQAGPGDGRRAYHLHLDVARARSIAPATCATLANTLRASHPSLPVPCGMTHAWATGFSTSHPSSCLHYTHLLLSYARASPLTLLQNVPPAWLSASRRLCRILRTGGWLAGGMAAAAALGISAKNSAAL